MILFNDRMGLLAVSETTVSYASLLSFSECVGDKREHPPLRIDFRYIDLL